MKRTFVATMFCMMGCFLFCPTGAAGENLIANGGFEEGDKEPIGWQVNTPGDIKGKVKFGKNVIWEKGSSPSGKCMKFLMNEKAPEWTAIAEIEGFGYASDFIPVKFGKTYRVYADIKGIGDKNPKKLPVAFIFVKGYKKREDNKKLMVYQFQVDCELKEPEKWQHFEGEFTIPKESIEEVQISVYACYPRGIVWFDNAGLIEKGE